MTRCRVCAAAPPLETLLDAGQRPFCNHFVAEGGPDAPTHRLAIGLCDECASVQLLDPAPPAALVAPYDWITYIEPDGHLDPVADMVAELRPGGTAVGIGDKDETVLSRLAARGLEIAAAGAGSVADVVIARHVLEHEPDPRRSLAKLESLVQPGGLIVLEVPDCTRSFEALDYTVLWEEHVLYFTPRTLRLCIESAGLRVLRLEPFPYAIEDSLVAFATREDAPGEPDLSDGRDEERVRLVRFAEALPRRREAWRRYLERWRERGQVVVFGAGHLACTFVGVMEVEDCISFVVDDNPHKQSLLMPGSRLPIKPSSALLEEDVALCLLAVSHGSEEKIIPRLGEFVDRGGTVGSLLPASSHAVDIDEL